METTQSRTAPVFVWRILTVIWAFNMFWMSSGRFSGAHSESMLRALFELLGFAVSPNSVDLLNSVLRKAAHVVEYAILGFLIYRSLGNQYQVRSRLQLGTWCVLATSMYSLTDELHQSFVPGRHASLIDCGIDTLGAAVAMLLVYASTALLKKRNATSGRSTAQ